MATIESVNNPRFKLWKKLAAGQVKKTGRTLVCGQRITREVAREPALAGRLAAWIVPQGMDDSRLPGPGDVPVHGLAPKLFAQLDIYGTGQPLLEVDVSGLIGPASAPTPGLYLVLPLQDPTNVGAAIRTAAGLSAAGAILLPSSANPFHPKAVRSSAGSVFRLPLMQAEDLEHLTGLGLTLVGLDRSGSDIAQFEFPSHTALVIGQEGPGLESVTEKFGTNEADRATMKKVSLPMTGIESYNAGVAAAIAMYEWHRRPR